MYMHSVPFFSTNSTMMSLWWLDWSVLVILRIYWYVYAFCIIFQHKFNCDYYGYLCSHQNDLFWSHDNRAEMRCKSVLFPLWNDMGQKICVIISGTHYKNIAFKFIEISKYWLFIVFLLTNYMHWVHRCTWWEWAIAMHGRYESHILFMSFTYVYYIPIMIFLYFLYTLF
jgi:hypothetical protein